jgi:hypothetical protein
MSKKPWPDITTEIHELWGANSIHDRIMTAVHENYEVGQTFSPDDVMKHVTTSLPAGEVLEAFMWIAYRTTSFLRVSYVDQLTDERWDHIEGLKLLASLKGDEYHRRAKNITLEFTYVEEEVVCY